MKPDSQPEPVDPLPVPKGWNSVCTSTQSGVSSHPATPTPQHSLGSQVTPLPPHLNTVWGLKSLSYPHTSTQSGVSSHSATPTPQHSLGSQVTPLPPHLNTVWGLKSPRYPHTSTQSGVSSHSATPTPQHSLGSQVTPLPPHLNTVWGLKSPRYPPHLNTVWGLKSPRYPHTSTQSGVSSHPATPTPQHSLGHRLRPSKPPLSLHPIATPHLNITPLATLCSYTPIL